MEKMCEPRTTIYRYGVKVLCNANHTLILDKANRNRMWQDAIALVIKALQKIEGFESKGTRNIPI
eukprot:2539403-Ditylum_brightwellii.AAC.1